MDLTKRKRLAKLKQFPDGFLIEVESECNRYCDLCREQLHNGGMWWNQYGTCCPKCHQNFVNKVIPASIMEDNDYFTDKDIKYELKLKKADLEKFIVDNKLEFHELKDEQGVTYIRIFLKDENVNFVKGRKLRQFSPPQFIDDGKGGHFIL